MTTTEQLLDLLDAITEVRVANPDFRASTLSALNLAMGTGSIRSGRVYALRHDGEIQTIIGQGAGALDDEDERRLVGQVRDGREGTVVGEVTALPLGKDRRIHGVLVLEAAEPSVAHLLADLVLQWLVLAEFLNLQKAELVEENWQLREEIHQQVQERNLIGVSGLWRRVVESAQRVAPSTATVLIQGETGTGKELVARLIHTHSPRCNRPFISVNCGALTESLLETELFGHVKGAFTGAVADRKGRFESADGGTIFLDEIGEVSPAMQVRLLRVLQEMEIVRVGDHRTRKLDVRVVAATNRDLSKEVAEGRFRSDLFYRLNVVHLLVPPLRQRPEDVPLLVEHFLGVYCKRNCKYITSVSRDVLDVMKGYAWPGNVRELENCIEKMVVLAPGSEITPDLLPMSMLAYTAEDAPARTGRADVEALLKRVMQAEIHACRERDGSDLYEAVRAKWERYLLEAVLVACKNNKSAAARMLGITRNTLNSRLGDLSVVQRQWNVG